MPKILFRHLILIAVLFSPSGAALALDAVQIPATSVPLVNNPFYHNGLRADMKTDFMTAIKNYRMIAENHRKPRVVFHLKLSEQILANLGYLEGSLTKYFSYKKLSEMGYFRRKLNTYLAHLNMGIHVQNKFWALNLDLGILSNKLFLLAEKHFLEAKKIRPRTANPVICLAALYAQKDQIQRAKAYWKQWRSKVRIRPDDFYNLAFMYKTFGEMNQSFNFLKRAINIESRHKFWLMESDDFREYLKDPRMKNLLKRKPYYKFIPRSRPYSLRKYPWSKKYRYRGYYRNRYRYRGYYRNRYRYRGYNRNRYRYRYRGYR